MNSGSGIHSVCVCKIHQTVRLLTAVLPYDYKELLALIACNIENRYYMLHWCDDCPGKNGIHEFLASFFEEADDDEVKSSKQWIKNGNSQIMPSFSNHWMNASMNCAHK